MKEEETGKNEKWTILLERHRVKETVSRISKGDGKEWKHDKSVTETETEKEREKENNREKDGERRERKKVRK